MVITIDNSKLKEFTKELIEKYCSIHKRYLNYNNISEDILFNLKTIIRFCNNGHIKEYQNLYECDDMLEIPTILNNICSMADINKERLIHNVIMDFLKQNGLNLN